MSLSIKQMPYWRLSSLYFTFFITAGVYLPYWSLYLQSIGFDAQMIGFLSMIVVAAKIFSPYLWGWIVDQTGRQAQIIRLSSFLSIVFFSGVFFYQGFWPFAIILLLFSICWSGALPQIETVTFSHLGEASQSYPIIRIWGSIGFIVTVLGLGFAFERLSIGYTPLLLMLSMVMVWAVSLFLPELPRQQEIPHDTPRPPACSLELIALLSACFLMLASHAPYYTFYSVYLQAHGYHSEFIGQMWALGVLAEIVLFLFMRQLLQFGIRKWLFLGSFVLATVRWLLIGFCADSLFCLICAQILHAATFGIYHAVAIQYINQLFTGRWQSRGQGLYSGIGFGAGLACGTLITGLLWDRLGSQQVFALAACASSIAAVIVAYGLRR